MLTFAILCVTIFSAYRIYTALTYGAPHMAHNPATTDSPLNVKLDPTERQMIAAMAEHSGLTMSLIVKQSIRARYAMQYDAQPTCADGNRCLCPQLHARPVR